MLKILAEILITALSPEETSFEIYVLGTVFIYLGRRAFHRKANENKYRNTGSRYSCQARI
jgi:hypothetical protein